MKEFLLNNWYYLLIGVLAVASFIVSFILNMKKSKSANIMDSIKEALLENIPFWATISEGFATGQAKKDNVITLGVALVSRMLGRKLSADENDYFIAFIGEQLEKILSTPQKKMIAELKVQKGKYTTK